MKSLSVLLAMTFCLGPSLAFNLPKISTQPNKIYCSKEEDNGKTVATSILAAAYLLTNVFSVEAAVAFDAVNTPSNYADSSSVILAARSGGRAGGRAAPRMQSTSPSTRIVNTRTTVIAAPPVIVGGGYGYGYGGGFYDPTPGIALNLGLNAVSAVGNGIREYRQTEEISRSRAELSAAREREAEMSERIRALEQMQMQKGGQPVYYAQPSVSQLSPTP